MNDVSEKDAYLLPQATLDKLRDARYLLTLDLKNGYWQIPLALESHLITAFTIPRKDLMQFRMMPFGLHSASTMFQRLLDTMLGPELDQYILVYLDDIIIASQMFDEYLTEVFRRFREAPSKPRNAILAEVNYDT